MHAHESRAVLPCPLVLAPICVYCRAIVFFFLRLECVVRIVLLLFVSFEGKLNFFHTLTFLFHLSVFFFSCGADKV